ncbi:MAG: hypothetical protein GF330_11205 [Candidatus Eisenbacteria bacterium]|nr:hypothetical protein [Candidatus Eisenbacteria bacterium]
MLLVAGIGLLWVGCGEEQVARPEETVTNRIVAFYQSEEDFELGLIELNGEREDIEWGSEFTPQRPYTHVRLSAADGAGDPGPPRYVSLKAVYTDQHLYILAQWVDSGPDQLKDVFVYVGPDLGAPIISCAEVGGETICDSLFRHAAEDSLLSPAWWTRAGDDDKLALAFEMDPAFDDRAGFSDVGCQVACHPGESPPFGPMSGGRIDIWYWLAGRTDPIRNLFSPYDDPNDPAQGIPGYLDDWYIDRAFGLSPDPGKPGYWRNNDPGSRIPKWVYRCDDDNFCEPTTPDQCENEFGESCRPNNGLAEYYLWRESATARFDLFSPTDTLNQATRPDMRKWQPGDIVPGYLMTYPRGSRADVRGKGGFEEEVGVWTLELARRLDTGDAASDVIFDPDAGREYYFTVALFDASTRSHWGSRPQVLVFGPRDGEEE